MALLRFVLVAVSAMALTRASHAQGNPEFVTAWGSTGSGAGQFNSPTAVAAGCCMIFVVDQGNNRIQWFSEDGTWRGSYGSLGTGPGQFNFPAGVAVTDRIPPHYCCFFVADALNNRIARVCDDGGGFIDYHAWGTPGSGDGQFSFPEAVAVDGAGRVYVADRNNNRIQVLDGSTGGFLGKWGSFGVGDGQLNAPIGVALGTGAGCVFAYVVEELNFRVQKFTLAGAFVTKWGSYGSGPGQFNYPWDIATRGGVVYVADTSNHRIQMFGEEGTFLGAWGSMGSGNGQFNQPHGVAVDAHGSIYVADTNNNRIQKFQFEREVNHDLEQEGEVASACAAPLGDTTWIADWSFDTGAPCGRMGWTATGCWGRLFQHISDNDVCTENTTCAWLWSDSATPTVAACPQNAFGPGLFVVAPGLDDILISPWVSLATTPTACSTVLDFHLFPGNDFRDGRIVHSWSVRWRSGSSVSPWAHGESWNSLSLWSWIRRVEDMTPYLDPAAADVQVAFRVADWGPAGFGCATASGRPCHTGPGPYLDRIRIGRRIPTGPAITEGTDSRSQAQDAFPTFRNGISPGEHFSPSTDRFGTCAFSRGGDLSTCPSTCVGGGTNLITGDSICVTVEDCRGSGSVTVNWCGAIVAGPHLGKSPAPWTAGVGGFFCVPAENARNAAGAILPNVWCVDLDDTYFRGGDVLLYFWKATDVFGGFTSDPPGMTDFPGSVAAAESATCGLLEVSYLPGITWAPAYLSRIGADPHGDLDPTPTELALSSQAHCILYVQMTNSRRRSGAMNRTSFMYTLDRVGYWNAYDVYDMQGFGNTNNHLASRATTEQVKGYSLIIQDTGRRRTATIPNGLERDSEKINQTAWYRQWLADACTHPSGIATLWILGENVAEERALDPLLAADMGVTLVHSDEFPAATVDPEVQGQGAFMWSTGGATNFSGDRFGLGGGCPIRRDYDGLGAAGGAVMTHRYRVGSMSENAAIVMKAGSCSNTIMAGFSWSDIHDAPGAPPGTPQSTLATKILNAVLPLACLGVPCDTPQGQDIDAQPAVTALHQNLPNPFNPTTSIWFDLARAERVQLRVYSVSGRLVRTLADGEMQGGRHVATWNGLDDAGRPVSSGLYLYQLETSDYRSTKKMVTLR